MKQLRHSLIVGALFLTAACNSDVTEPRQRSLSPAGDGDVAGVAGAALLPDLVTAVPGNLMVRSKGGANIYFTNVIANLGAGPFQVRPVNQGSTTTAYQQLLDSSGQIVSEFPVSIYAYHPTHQHWHIDDVALYSLRQGTLDGPVVAEASKVSFCLIDIDQIIRPGAPRTYRSCNAALQGITNGWADVYFRGLPDQNLPIAGLPAGAYYLVSISDPQGRFSESNETNNMAWQKIQLSYVGGAPRIALLEHSPCEAPLCGGGK